MIDAVNVIPDPMAWERWGLGAVIAAIAMSALAWLVRTWLSRYEATIKASEEERKRLQEQNAAQTRESHAELMTKLEEQRSEFDERYAALLERYHQLLERQAASALTTQDQLASLVRAATGAIEAILAKLPPSKGARTS